MKVYEAKRSGSEITVSDVHRQTETLDIETLARAASQDDAELAAEYYAIYRQAGGTATQDELRRYAAACELLRGWKEAIQQSPTTIPNPKEAKMLRGNRISHLGVRIRRECGNGDVDHRHPRHILNAALAVRV